MPAHLFADIDDLDIIRQILEESARGKTVHDDDIGRRQELRSAHREQAVLAGTTTDQGHPSSGRSGPASTRVDASCLQEGTHRGRDRGR